MCPQLYAYRLGYTSGRWTGSQITSLVLLIIVSFLMMGRECITLAREGRRNYPFNWFDAFLIGVITLNAGLYFGINSILSVVLERMHLLDPKIFISFQVRGQDGETPGCLAPVRLFSAACAPQFTTLLNSTVQFGLGLLVVLATVRCWRVLSFATHFQVVKIMLVGESCVLFYRADLDSHLSCVRLVQGAEPTRILSM